MIQQNPILLLLVLAITTGCQCGKDDEDEDTSSSPNRAVTVNANAPAQVSLTKTPILMTPEQMSHQIHDIFGQRGGHWQYMDGNEPSEEPGVFYDEISHGFARDLGGIDNTTVFHRDRTIKVQRLLAVRRIAWQVANAATAAALGQGEADHKNIFSIADIKKDRPWNATPPSAAQQEEEKKWRDQTVQLYWTIFSRAPTETEIALHRAAFIGAVEAGKLAWSGGWTLQLYAMLQSVEFWSL